MPSSAPRAVPTATAAGVARPSAHGHAITSTAIMRSSAIAAVAAPSTQPADERQRRDREHGGHEHRRHAIGEPRDRRLLALRVLDGARDPRERGVGAGARDAHRERAVLVERARVDRRAFVLVDGQALAGQHRLVERGAAFDDRAVGGDPLAGPHDDDVARRERRGLDVALDVAIGVARVRAGASDSRPRTASESRARARDSSSLPIITNATIAAPASK